MESINGAGKPKLHLFADERATFAILDGASVPGLLDTLYRLRPEHECLYRGELKPDIAEVAPYLVRLEAGSEFADWIVDNGWGNHWGIFALSREEFSVIHRHLRTFLVVYDPDGKPLYFRYYDPRVLRVYLPTCNAEELANVFGPVESYILEDEKPEVLVRFHLESGALQQDKVKLED